MDFWIITTSKHTSDHLNQMFSLEILHWRQYEEETVLSYGLFRVSGHHRFWIAVTTSDPHGSASLLSSTSREKSSPRISQLVADPRNLVLKKCACPSFYVVNYADLLSKAQNMHTLHYFKMHTSFLLSIENNLRLIVFVLIARKKCCRAVEETS